MMHGREKSDSAIVAMKPTNKAVPTAAEPVEPRAGAKGNARQQSTHRTQGRERVAQALERVRQAARQRKKEGFTALPPRGSASRGRAGVVMPACVERRWRIARSRSRHQRAIGISRSFDM
jgi:hypothetical protein